MQVLKYSTKSGSEPVTADEVKSWLKVDFTDEDDLITLLITQIRGLAEQAANRSFIAGTIEYFEEDTEILSDWIKLPYPNHNDITEVVLDGNTVTDYYETGNTQKLIRVTNFVSTAQSNVGLKVTYTTTGFLPDGFKLAMLKEIAETYEKRGNTFEGSVSKLTSNFYNYLQTIKVY